MVDDEDEDQPKCGGIVTVKSYVFSNRKGSKLYIVLENKSVKKMAVSEKVSRTELNISFCMVAFILVSIW